MHIITDQNGMPLGFKNTPANAVEWRQVRYMLRDISGVIPTFRKVLQADKGYDCEQLRLQLSYKFRMGSRISKRKHNKDQSGGKPVGRYVVERTIGYLQRGFRRLEMCWERTLGMRNALTRFAFMMIYMKKLI